LLLNVVKKGIIAAVDGLPCVMGQTDKHADIRVPSFHSQTERCQKKLPVR